MSDIDCCCHDAEASPPTTQVITLIRMRPAIIDSVGICRSTCPALCVSWNARLRSGYARQEMVVTARFLCRSADPRHPRNATELDRPSVQSGGRRSWPFGCRSVLLGYAGYSVYVFHINLAEANRVRAHLGLRPVTSREKTRTE